MQVAEAAEELHQLVVIQIQLVVLQQVMVEQEQHLAFQVVL